MTLWLLGTHLAADAPYLEDHGRALMVEARSFADRRPVHPHRLTLVFAAMRHFRDRLRDRGLDVDYRQVDRFGDALDAHFEAGRGDHLAMPRPAAHGAPTRLRRLVEARGGTLEFLDNPTFLFSPVEFDDWAAGRDTTDPGTYRQERWYRHARRQTGILMDGDAPAGGQWNYDEENRETPPADWDPPEVPRFEPDDTTREVQRRVADAFETFVSPGETGDFVWPVTGTEARNALEQFIEHRLAEFGPYQDAMVEGEWALCHSLLSTSLNLGLLDPMTAIRRAEAAYESGDAPLQSVEGFVRQVLGWREFVRHVYRREMPGLRDANQLGQRRGVPEAFWTGETDMACLAEALQHVRERGYAHHVERLMVLSNLALVIGTDPADLNEWFLRGFVDAAHWVATPNVLAMGSFATDALASKPYASSGNYIDRMSDYCDGCRYDVDERTGEGACPFNSLYWQFLRENEDLLRGTGRMGPVYARLDDIDDAEKAAIADRARLLRDRASAGDL